MAYEDGTDVKLSPDDIVDSNKVRLSGLEIGNPSVPITLDSDPKDLVFSNADVDVGSASPGEVFNYLFQLNGSEVLKVIGVKQGGVLQKGVEVQQLLNIQYPGGSSMNDGARITALNNSNGNPRFALISQGKTLFSHNAGDNNDLVLGEGNINDVVLGNIDLVDFGGLVIYDSNNDEVPRTIQNRQLVITQVSPNNGEDVRVSSSDTEVLEVTTNGTNTVRLDQGSPTERQPITFVNEGGSGELEFRSSDFKGGNAPSNVTADGGSVTAFSINGEFVER